MPLFGGKEEKDPNSKDFEMHHTAQNPFFDSHQDTTAKFASILGFIKNPIETTDRRYKGTRTTDKVSQIVGYSQTDLRVYRALFITSRTFLVNWDTYYHLLWLTFVSMVAFTIAFAIPHMASSLPIELTNTDLLTRQQTLLSYVMVSFVGLNINRFTVLRDKLGMTWGALENMTAFSFQLLPDPDPKSGHLELRELILRLARQTYHLLFYAAQKKEDMSFLVESEEKGGLHVMTAKEMAMLKASPPGVRPFITVSWLYSIIDAVISKQPDMGSSSGSSSSSSSVNNTYNIMHMDQRRRDLLADYKQAKGGIGALLGTLGTPIPFMYSHLVYWTVQVLLFTLAWTTGLYLAVMWDRRKNGAGMFEFDDDARQYPQNQAVWYFNVWLYRVFGNILFALFMEGLLKICELIENPFRGDSFGLPLIAYDSFMYNNIRGMAAGMSSYTDILSQGRPDAFGLGSSIGPVMPNKPKGF
jgi:hypothetical protein